MNTFIRSSFYPDQFRLEHIKGKMDQIEKGLKKSEKKDKALYKACQDFEAIFMQMVFKEMRKTVHKSKLIDGGFAEEIFEDMMDEEIAKRATRKDSSLADLLYQQLRLQLNQNE
ncbi:hypothetical protein BBF96_10880 [Anoxybacter fermentans]|uniref:Flagellar protein FlgJ N-terminal domain-containing protein n=1 Tax=Anoxybacter fermentans TaxID=1323375 RepID=A0A3Q9HR16_9FIRM|nr:rod-binding protein [Anoxybacter fermentans]AZR73846.1 hypothetical protein BBF96_10880 [Anoxybacter fermentans]